MIFRRGPSAVSRRLGWLKLVPISVALLKMELCCNQWRLAGDDLPARSLDCLEASRVVEASADLSGVVEDGAVLQPMVVGLELAVMGTATTRCLGTAVVGRNLVVALSAAQVRGGGGAYFGWRR